MPLAYIARTFPSISETSFWCFGTTTGLNVPSLSLGTEILASPKEP